MRLREELAREGVVAKATPEREVGTTGFEAWSEQLRRGALEMAILLALAPEPRYGLQIIRHLADSTDLIVAEGTVYPILSRLTRDRLLEATWSEEGVHPRKYYRLTARGRARLAEMTRFWEDFTGKMSWLIVAARGGRHESD
jgi:PadR family transcriptional regulator PadR